MKRNLLTMLLVGLCSLTASAYDFEYRGIYYNITSSATVEVTLHSSNKFINGRPASNYSYSGKVIVPTTVSYNGQTYRVTSIGNNAFSWCEELTSITIPESVTSIGDGAFYECSSLTSITIPESVTSIGEEAFSWCSNLTSITIPESVTSIGEEAFSWCSNLTSITISEGVTSIGSSAFEGCNSLTTITCKAIEPPVAGHDAFYGIDPNIPVYVPAESLEYYQSLNDWGYFTNYFALEPEPDPEHTITYRVDGEIFKSESLLPGTPITLPEAPTKEGYAFSGWSWTRKVYETSPINLAANADAMLYTNAKCTNTSYGDQFVGWHVLFDGNATTFFHSEYSNVDSEDGQDHYLRVDMGEGKSVSEFTFTYTTRGNIPTNGNYSPKTMVVEGSNTASGGYTEIATLNNLPNSAADVYESEILGNGNAYRYIRFRVTETFNNIKVQGHPYFFMAEFGMTEYEAREEAAEVPETMPAEDIVIHGSFVEITNQLILDTTPEYGVTIDTPCPRITYTRNFADTEWQPLYVPFEMAYEEICNDFEVAYIYNTRQYDHDEDGVKDETVIEAFKMKEGTLEANYPYLIRAKEAGEKSIVVTDATLYATEENTIDCASVFDTYTFKGTYSQLSSTTLTPGEGYYTLVGGEWQPVTESTTLGAFRFYLKVDSRHGAPAAEARNIRMRFVGENNNDDDATGIENAEIKDEKSRMIYDLQGRRVTEPTKGMYIVNGKKVVIK